VLPDVPILSDFVPGYEASSWYGIGGPKGTLPDIIDKMNKEINAGGADPKIRARFAELGGYSRALLASSAISLLQKPTGGAR
jgi:tripartite-type tricarboxylate transporter receptor subunit TctC